MTEFHAQIAGIDVDLSTQCITVGFGDGPDGEDGSILISGSIPEDELPEDEEAFDNGDYTICIDSAAVSEACVRKWKVEKGKLSLLLSPEGAEELEVDDELTVFFPAEHTKMVKESLTKIFVMYGEGPAPVPWEDA